jgi:perosamine synthetase
MIPLSSPDITETEISAVTDVLRTARLSLGPQMEAFEQAFAQYVNSPHAVAVSSGTAALHLCLRALDIGPGDEVIVPSFSFIAVANVIRYEQAVPVFVDIDSDSLNLSPDCIVRAITPRTRAIIVVHTFGRPAELASILEIARRHRLVVIEDACEAIGAECEGRRVGTFGDVGVFGFYPNKQITTGEGGMVVSSRTELARRIRALRNQGRYESEDWFQHAELGYNYRISELNCALGLAQLSRIDEILRMREDVAERYHHALKDLEGLILPALQIPHGRISWFVYVVRLQAKFDRDAREQVLKVLTSAGIGCGRYFAPIHMQPSYSAWRNSDSLQVTEAQACRTIALPFFNRMTADQIARVCTELRSALRRVA